MDIYLPIAGQSVNALFIVVLGFLVGVLSGMFGVGGGFLTTPLLIFYGIPPTGRRRVGRDPDHRRQRVGRDGPHAPRRRRPEDGRRDDRRRPVRLGRRRGAVPAAPVDRPDRCRDRLPLRPHPRLDRRADAQGCAGRARLCRRQAPAKARRRATTAGSPRCRCAGASTARASTFRPSRRWRSASSPAC